MARFILIDEYTGFIWGDVQAADPVAAAKAVDNDCRADAARMTYAAYSPRSGMRRNGLTGYMVYQAPEDFPEVDDGQAAAMIERVESALPAVAFVAVDDAVSA